MIFNTCETVKWLPMLAFQSPFCRVQGFLGRATGAAARGEREAEEQCLWPPLTLLEWLHFYRLDQLKFMMIPFE